MWGPGSPFSQEYRDPGPHFHRNMRTPGPHFRGSPLSHDTGCIPFTCHHDIFHAHSSTYRMQHSATGTFSFRSAESADRQYGGGAQMNLEPAALQQPRGVTAGWRSVRTSRARNSPPQIRVSLVAAYIRLLYFGKTTLAGRAPKTSLTSQTQPTPMWVAFSITLGDAESNLRWMGLVVLACKTTPKAWLCL